MHTVAARNCLCSNLYAAIPNSRPRAMTNKVSSYTSSYSNPCKTYEHFSLRSIIALNRASTSYPYIFSVVFVSGFACTLWVTILVVRPVGPGRGFPGWWTSTPEPIVLFMTILIQASNKTALVHVSCLDNIRDISEESTPQNWPWFLERKQQLVVLHNWSK